MSDTTAHYSALLTRIDLKISALVENPQVDYQVGGGNGTVKITASQKLDQLMKLRESILKRITSKPEEVIETLQTDFSAFGEDFNTYINEDL